MLSVFGTRPEAIKMAPVLQELGRIPDRIESVVCVTAQHRQMLDDVLTLFRIRPDFDLDLMEENQDPSLFAARAVTALAEVLVQASPDLVLVQGDTTTAMAVSLAAFYRQVPIGHIEAGLRTGNRYEPFPEEVNRRLIAVLASYHFAPTQTAADALCREGVCKDSIFVTGNTVIDALLHAVALPACTGPLQILPHAGNEKLILVTAHRRENLGRPLAGICEALRTIVKRNPDVEIVYPVHLNPKVREPVYRILSGLERIHLVEPLNYHQFAELMKRAYLILTDSGGIQEEAPALGKPVLVMRNETERPEGIVAGTSKIVGVEPDAIVRETELLIQDHAAYERMARAINPYGEGKAAERIVAAILQTELAKRGMSS